MADEDDGDGNQNVKQGFVEFYKKYYDERIRMLPDAYGDREAPSLEIDYRKLKDFDSGLSNAIRMEPSKYFEIAKTALQEYLDDEYEDSPLSNADLRISNFTEVEGEENLVGIRNIRSKHVGTMITVEGIVKTASKVLPRVEVAEFRCRSCGTTQRIPQENPSTLKYPFSCANGDCGSSSKRSFEVLKERSEKVDFQKIVVEEPPEDLRGGQSPMSVNAYIRGDITGDINPGDRASITGVLKSSSDDDNPVFSTYIEANNIEKEEKEFEEIEITEEDEERIKELASQDNIVERISQSFAPSIYGYDDVKLAIAMQLFSGVTKDVPDKHIRGDIHNLLIGDPGTGKSEIIESAREIAPRGVYTVGKGSSAAGLTASAVKDSDISGEQKWSLEAGALVLADKGLAAVDEIDKMRDEDRSALHEALEQQSYHPETEVLLANGERRKMGELVDELMADNKDVTDAVNCEILDMEDGELRLHTVNFEDGTYEKIDVDRVSRHDAPDQMVEVTFSNGRSVVVTPEHPLYTIENGEISTMDAINAEPGDFVPAPRELPNSATPVSLETTNSRKPEQVQLPETLTTHVAEILGYLAADGHSSRTEHVIEYTGSTEQHRARFTQLVRSAFGDVNIDRNQNGDGIPTLQVNSKQVYKWFEDNHPEILTTPGQRRMPASVLGSSSEHIRRFLIGAFASESQSDADELGLTTTSKELAEDYADAMLKIGVSSQIVEYTTNGETYYRTLVKEDSTSKFTEKVTKPSERAAPEVGVSQSFDDSGAYRGMLPTDFVEVIKTLRETVGLTNDGALNGDNTEIDVSTAEEHLDEIDSRASQIERSVKEAESLRQLRDLIGWSQERLANEIGEMAAVINYVENDNGYSDSEQEQLRKDSISAIEQEMKNVHEKTERMRELFNFRYEKITDVEVRDNTGDDQVDWVYDLTVEPTRTFVGKGVVLHNTVSVNKAGINATLKSRCSLLAAANPKYGRFDEYEPVGEQIDMEPALISRFDLIFTLTDQPDKEHDERLADHILDGHISAKGNAEEQENDPYEDTIDPDLLRKYIAYARQNCNPSITEEVREEIKTFYSDLRQQGDDDAPIPITARAVDSMVRLTEAIARMRLADTATREDAKRAKEIKNVSMEDVGVDPITGELDADAIESGTTKSQRDTIENISELFEEMKEEYEGSDSNGVPRDELVERASERFNQPEDEVDKRLKKMERKGNAYSPTSGRIVIMD